MKTDWAVKLTTWAKTNNIVHVQNLVKRFNGRFVSNPIYYSTGRTYLTLTFDDASNASKFSLHNSVLSSPFA